MKSLGPSVKGHRAETILQKAQSQLLNERVRQVHFAIDALTVKSDQILEDLTLLLPSEVLVEVSKFVEEAQASQHLKSKER